MNHLFLTGFMGAGKSTVGPLVAARFGQPFVDLDALIEAREGLSIPAIFEARGEAGFRDAEHAALASLATAPATVVATGGGVVLREENRALLRRLGTVVYLAVTPEESLARIGGGEGRPLLAGRGIDAAREIMAVRAGLYESCADVRVDTVGSSAGEVVAEVVARMSGEVVRVRDPHGGGYDVRIKPGLLDEIGARVRGAVSGDAVALVTDSNVNERFGARVTEALRAAGLRVERFVVPAGEESKSWVHAGELLEAFAAAGLDRSSGVVALGGGVVGDLAGFCASAYMRGIALVHVPTTLLAQVDSAIGGKTGVDLAAGKNLAGAFWPPRLVLADTDALATLPDAEWTNGLVEAAKAALLLGGQALERFEADAAALVARDPGAVLRAVRDAAAFKGRVVSTDLREADIRECLNFGHTLGHALELVIGYGALPHGLAVAEGMRFAVAVAEQALGAAPATGERVRTLLEAVGAGERAYAAAVADRPLPAAPALVRAMRGDKKSRGGEIRFVLLESPGAWTVRAVDEATLLGLLQRWSGVEGE